MLLPSVIMIAMFGALGRSPFAAVNMVSRIKRIAAEVAVCPPTYCRYLQDKNTWRRMHFFHTVIMVPRTHSVRRGHSVLKINFLAVAIFVKKLRKFSTKPLPKFFLDFIRFGLSIKNWKLDFYSPPPPIKGLWDFSRFGLSIKSWKLAVMHHAPLPPSPHRKGMSLNFNIVDARDHLEPLSGAPRLNCILHTN